MLKSADAQEAVIMDSVESETKAQESTASSGDKGQQAAVSTDKDWDTDVEKILKDWRQRVYAAQAGHYKMAQWFRRGNYFLGVAATVFSSVVGTELFVGLEKNSPRATLIAFISIGAAVSAGLQTLLKFSEHAERHAIAAHWYSAIRRDIEQVLHLPPKYRVSPKDYLDGVRKEMNRVTQTSPELSVFRWRREAQRFRVSEPWKAEGSTPATGNKETGTLSEGS